MADVVTFGELMLRLTTPGRQRIAQAQHLEMGFGGAEANVAVMIAQLGGSAGFVTRLPANALADRALEELRGLRVDVAGVQRGGDRIGVYYLEQGASQRPGRIIYDRGASAFAEVDPGAFEWGRLLEGARWLHWSGITPALSPEAAELTRHACATARAAGLRVSFDMNYRSKLWGAEEAGRVLRPLMTGVDLCVCGVEEARSVLGVDGESEAEVAEGLQAAYGFQQVAMTRRRAESADRCKWGGVLFESAQHWESAWYDVEIVDRVGAGDGFTGALIYGLLSGKGAGEALEFAVAAGALKHTIVGDYNRVGREEVEALVGGVSGGRVQR